MSSVRSCCLCGAAELKNIGELAVSDVVELYRERFNLEIKKLSSSIDVDCLQYSSCLNCGLRQFFPYWIGLPSLYGDLQKYSWYYKAEKHEFDVASAFIKPGDRVLEVGCGSGEFGAILGSLVQYVGVESNPDGVAIARSRGLNVSNMNVLDLDGEFSVVCLFQVLEHVLSPGELLCNLSKKLKEGGRLIVSVPAEDSFMGFEVNNILNLPPHHLTRWSDSTLHKISEIIGLRYVGIFFEPLELEHFGAYSRAKVGQYLWSKLEPESTLIRRGWRKKVFGFVGRIVQFVIWPYLVLKRKKLRGHTVTIVLERPGSDEA